MRVCVAFILSTFPSFVIFGCGSGAGGEPSGNIPAPASINAPTSEGLYEPSAESPSTTRRVAEFAALDPASLALPQSLSAPGEWVQPGTFPELVQDCEDGNGLACLGLSARVRDVDARVALLVASCRAGHRNGCGQLGSVMVDYQGNASGLEFAQAACAAYDTRACSWLMMEDRASVDANFWARACEYECESGDAHSCGWLAGIEWHAEGDTRDRQRILSNLRTACPDDGPFQNRNACVALGLLELRSPTLSTRRKAQSRILDQCDVSLGETEACPAVAEAALIHLLLTTGRQAEARPLTEVQCARLRDCDAVSARPCANRQLAEYGCRAESQPHQDPEALVSLVLQP